MIIINCRAFSEAVLSSFHSVPFYTGALEKIKKKILRFEIKSTLGEMARRMPPEDSATQNQNS